MSAMPQSFANGSIRGGSGPITFSSSHAIGRDCLWFCIFFDIFSEVIGHSPMRFRTALTFLALSVAGTSSAFATSIVAEVHIAAHRLNVSVGGKPTYSWGIATARRGYHTPRGTYHVTALDIDAYSRNMMRLCHMRLLYSRRLLYSCRTFHRTKCEPWLYQACYTTCHQIF